MAAAVLGMSLVLMLLVSQNGEKGSTTTPAGGRGTPRHAHLMETLAVQDGTYQLVMNPPGPSPALEAEGRPLAPEAEEGDDADLLLDRVDEVDNVTALAEDEWKEETLQSPSTEPEPEVEPQPEPEPPVEPDPVPVAVPRPVARAGSVPCP